MQNLKFYSDIKRFPAEFAEGIELAQNTKVEGDFNRVVLCGLGGSAIFVGLMNDYLESKIGVNLRIEANRSYNLPLNADEKTLFILVSHSGNTEETLSCYEEGKSKGYKYCIVTSGGKLMRLAQENSDPLILIPGDMNNRLVTGYLFSSIFKFLANSGLIGDYSQEIASVAQKLNVDEEYALKLAKEIKNSVPIIYATDNNKSIAEIIKIKFNETSKTQAFCNYFPELNHNEMVGYTNLVMKPYFLIFESKFTNERNKKRIHIFATLMQNQGAKVEIIRLKGDNLLEEMLNSIYLSEFITYYLAVEYNMDPDKVEMVDEFKKML